MKSQSEIDPVFERLQQVAAQQGATAALEFLEHQFRGEKKFFQLFEVLKMQVRTSMGLSLIHGETVDDLNEDRQRQLEDGLLAACAEIGSLLIQDGRLEEGWMYLQPVGDRKLVEKIVTEIPVDSENIDTVVEICFSQGAAPVYGYGLLMQHFGTCNAITTFETQAIRFDRSNQEAMASALLRHMYDELCANLNRIVEQENQTASEPTSLKSMLAEHPWLVAGGAHHIDATHLVSVMKIARIVVQPVDWQRALELAHYGHGLHSDFQYASPPPFEATYPDHQFFYQALLGEDVDAAIKHFEAKCETVDVDQFGPVAYETLVDLLVRIGRPDRAIEVLTGKVLGQHESLGIAPPIFQIATTPTQLQITQKFFRQQEDLLSYGISLLKINEG